MRDPHFKQMLDLFAMLKKGHCDGVKVRLGRLQNLISSSCMGINYILILYMYLSQLSDRLILRTGNVNL